MTEYVEAFAAMRLTSCGKRHGSSALDLISRAAELAIADGGLARRDRPHPLRLFDGPYFEKPGQVRALRANG
jgi:hypothetical protein